MADPISPEAIPITCEGLDITSMDITPEEGFLLSRLDGKSNVETLCSGASGLGKDKTMELLASLYEKKVIILRRPSGSEDSAHPEAPTCAETAAYDVPALKEILKEDLKKGPELIPLVEAIFVNLENLSYYDILGLRRTAEAGEIKKAYLRRTKYFHPDRFYRRADREFKRKLQEIFKQLNKGYRVLSDPEAKSAYDESLGFEQEEDEEEEVVAGPVAESRTRAVRGESSPWKRIRVPKQKPVEERKRTTEEEESKPEAEDKKLKLGLKDKKPKLSPLLRQIEKMETKGVKGTRSQAERFYQGAMAEKERGNLKAARINLQLAVQYDSLNEKYKQALAEVDNEEEGRKAELEFKAGLDAQLDGDLKSAMVHLRESLRLGLENANLYHRLAELAMELESNYERARALCLKAIEMEPDIAEFHMSLARAYKGLGQDAASAIQLEKVLKLDPKNKVAAKELKALKRG